ncbi:hypothetical protein [Nocardia sp. NPDC050710]|uniref:hypothetical protein n=1 Tax=Nocardia sp. NPDC050710 TaxID=3157220 RepID=UPI0033EB5D8C
MVTLPFILSSIAADLEREVFEIELAFEACSHHDSITGFNTTYGAGEDGCVVSLWDAWNRFMRALILTSCAGPFEGASGHLYTPPNVFIESAALLELKKAAKKTNIKVVRTEPNWYDSLATADFCSALSLPNAAVITSAVQSSQIVDFTGAIVPNPLSEVRKMRNYIAHKNHLTFSDITALGLSSNDPRAFISQIVTGGTSRFTEWTTGLIAVANAAVN